MLNLFIEPVGSNRICLFDWRKKHLIKKYLGKWITVVYNEFTFSEEDRNDTNIMDTHTSDFCQIMDYDNESIEVKLPDGSMCIIPKKEIWQIVFDPMLVSPRQYEKLMQKPEERFIDPKPSTQPSKTVNIFHVDVPHDIPFDPPDEDFDHKRKIE